VLRALSNHPLGDASPQTTQTSAKEVCEIWVERNWLDTSRNDLNIDQL